MKNEDKQIISDALNVLRQFSLKTGGLSIIVDNGPDESIIIGTEKDFLIAAIKFLEISLNVDSTMVDESFPELIEESGISYYSTDSIKYVFDDMGDVWPVCAFKLSDNEKKNQLLSFLKGNELNH